MQTIPRVLESHGMVGQHYKTNEQRMEIELPNESLIMCAGLDDKERVDKILGTDWITIYVNESQDVPYPTIIKLLTRLSQKIEGCQPKFIADLNPTGVAHWTYKLWMLGIDPQSREPINIAKYGKYALNPSDNADNLAPDYIHDRLEVLSGNARQRFLIGEYQSDSEIQVFEPRGVYRWEEFIHWVGDKWQDVRMVGGLDLGYQDCDAFDIIAYKDGKPETWSVFEHKAKRQSVQDLVNNIRRGIEYVRLNVPTPEQYFDIWTDTNTIRFGHEGDNKKNANELREIYGIPCRPAYKQGKGQGIDILRDDINAGIHHIPAGGIFQSESEQIVWTREEDGTIVRIIDDEIYHPDLMFAKLYAYRALTKYLNSALFSREQIFDRKTAPNYADAMIESLSEKGKFF
jgi:hypothetical protein